MENIGFYRVPVLGFLTMVLVFVAKAGESLDNMTSANKPTNEQRLIAHMTENIRASGGVHARPVLDHANSIVVDFNVSLNQILDFDTKRKVIKLLVWKTCRWTDELITWNPEKFGGIRKITLPSNAVWTPDIQLYNGETTYLNSRGHGHADLVVNFKGLVSWIPSLTLSSPCEADTTNFPFDTAQCNFTFGPWSHSTNQLDMTTNGSGFDLSVYMESSTWTITRSNSLLSKSKFACCDDSYTTVTYTLSLRRKPDFLLKVLVLPTVLLPLLAAATFWIPAERPDRIGVGVSLFGAFFLLLLLNSDYTPPEASSNLASLCGLNMTLIAFSIIVSIASVNISRQKGRIPPYTEKICLHGLGRIFRCLHSSDSKLASRDLREERVGRVEGENCSSQWKMVAVVLDRTMFVIFLVGIIIGFALLFPRTSL